MGWLVALVVLVVLSIMVFGGGVRGPAVAVTVLDVAVVRWLAGLEAPGLTATWQALAFLGSWWVSTCWDWHWWWRCWPCDGSGI